MTQKILNSTLCGLLAYFVLGLFLLGKGSFASATTPLLWQFRIFAMAGFLIVALGLLLLCTLGKRETDRSLRRLTSNPWVWGIFGLLTFLGYGAMMITSLVVGNAPYEPGDVAGVVGTWPFWVNAVGAIFFGASLSVLSAFIIVRQRKSTYSEVLLAVTVYVLILCVATFLLTHLPSPAVPWVNLAVVVLFWITGIATSRKTSQNPDESDKANEDTFNIRNSGHELPAMLISSLLGVFLFGLTSNSDGNPGPFDLGSNALFGMLTMSLVLMPIVYFLRKRNLVPIFYWLIFPLIASVLIVFDTFPKENILSFIGSAGVYFFCTIVFLFSLALLVMLVQNSESSPFLPIIWAEIILSLSCLVGIVVANAFPDSDVRGPIVLITATIYFIYVLLSPVLLFWQSRKLAQPTVVGAPGASGTDTNASQPETPDLSFDDRLNAIAATYGLSKREREILELVGKGYNSPYIAAALVISENTTRTHLKNIYRKLGVGSRMEVVELVNSWDQNAQNEPPSQMTVK